MILIKHSSSYQISHLYRLLYRKSIDEFFHSKGLYRSLDYLMYGTTYYKGGIVAIEIDFITEKAKKLATEARHLDIATDNTTIGIGFLQLLTEQKRTVAAPGGIDKVKAALDDLQKQPWQDMDNLETLDMRETDTKDGALILQKGTPSRLRTLTVSFSLNEEFTYTHPELLPLFEQLICFIDQNSWISTSMKYGIMSKGIDKSQNNKAFTLASRFKVHPQLHEIIKQRRTLKDVAYDYVDFVHNCHENGAIHRYSSVLQSARYDADSRRLLPGPGIVTDTGFVIGARGWHKLATKENCELLLKNMEVAVEYDRKKIKLPALRHKQ